MGCSESSHNIQGNNHLPDQLNYEIKDQRQIKQRPSQQEGLFEAQDESVQQFMATKPWMGALIAPTQKIKNDSSAPTKNLTLQFVNGFKVQDSRQNIFWSHKNDIIIYSAAAIGITMNINTLKQNFMGAGDSSIVNGHTNQIVSLGVNPDRRLVVTGSRGAQPLILLWDSDTMQIKGRTKLARNTRAVSTIRFSKNGKYFFCSDKHNDSNVYCFEVATMQLKGTQKCGSDAVINSQTGKDNRFACATKSGVWFFQYSQSQGMKKNRGVFGNNPRTAMASIAYSETGSFLSGSIDGFIFYWDGTTCSKVRKTHQGCVMAINCIGGNIYSSGTQDNLLKVTNYEGLAIRTYELPGYAKSIDAIGQKIIVGTKCGRIIKLEGETKNQIMHGHWTGETWGLALGKNGKVYTTADDNNIIQFNPKTYKTQKVGTINKIPGKKQKIDRASTLSLLPPNQQSRAITINKSGHIAIGINDGALSVRSVDNLDNEIFSAKNAQAWIEVIKFSPDQTKMAVGSHDTKIYIYEIKGNTYSYKGFLKGHTSYITQLDWSKDGNYIQSVCGAYELLFWNVNSLSQIASGASQFRDQHWSTYTVKLGWWVQGVFPPATDGTHVNGVDRTKDEKIILTADDWGLVNLYRNPCLKGAKAKSFRAHSSHVVRGLFNENDTYVYSVGGYDKTLMMWKLS